MGDRGLIVERSGRKVTVLRRDGDLVTFNTGREDIMVGMEIEVPVKPAFFTWKRLAPAVALSLVIVLVSTFGYQHYLHAQPVVAYVTLDSVGSVELEVNQAGIVRSARALDAAGEEALSAVQYRNRPAGEVVQALIKAQDPENKSGVVVALVPVADPEPTGKDAKKTERAIDRIEEKVIGGSSGPATNVTSLRLDAEIRDSAQELGISAGRAALWALTQPAPEPVEDPGSAQPGTEPTTDPGQATAPDPGDTTGPDDPVGHITTDPRDPGEPGTKAGPGTGQPGKSSQKDILEMIKQSLPKVDPDEWSGFNNKTNSKESQELLKDITKKWLQEISKQVGKQGKNDDDDDRRDDDRRDDEEKKDSPGQSKGNEDKKNQPGGPKGNDDKKNQPGEPKGNDDKGSQGKGNTSLGSGKGKDSSGGKQGKNDDDDDGRREDDHGNKGSQSKGTSSTNKSNYWADLLDNWFNRLPWRRK